MSEPRSLEHEREIADDPEDLARYAVYADWLLEHGSLRGEFAAIQLALAAREQPDLREREQQLLAQHPGLFHEGNHLGWIRRYLNMIEWRGGFLHRLGCEVHGSTLAEILKAPAARLLHTLHVVGVRDHPRRRGDFDQAVEAVAGAGLLGLQQLWLGSPPRNDFEWEHFGRRPCPDLRRLALACPRLQTLVVMAPCFDFGDPSSPDVEFAELLEFDARMGASREAVASLASVSFPKLRTLYLGFTSSSQADLEPMRWTPETLDPLLTGAATPALRRLILWETDEPSMDDTLLSRVRGSPLGQRLDQLELLRDRAPDSFEDPNSIFIFPLYST